MNFTWIDLQVAASESVDAAKTLTNVIQFKKHYECFRIQQEAMLFFAALLLSSSMAAAESEAVACQRKIDEIKQDRAKPGAVYSFTASEINAWARNELPKEVPQGMRNPSVQLGSGTAVGFAYVDFLKMQHSKGVKPGWLMEKLISGERPMRVSVEIQSAGGFATVFLRRVEISGVSASGTVLDFLIRSFFRPLYPDAHIDERFEMSHNVERVEIRPEGARVYIRKR